MIEFLIGVAVGAVVYACRGLIWDGLVAIYGAAKKAVGL